ncbi:MAG: septum site-determining protein MinC [Clostridia bacterium]|jgi:septum site-determining protein MinC
MPRQKRQAAAVNAAPAPDLGIVGVSSALERDRTLLIRRHLRSGHKIRYPGNVVVLGDVNPGAEIEAEGDIVVMGTLRGLAHAGAEGDRSRVVAAFRIAATQVRIAQYIARAPEGDVPPAVPEVALVRDGQVLIDSYAKYVAERSGD